MSILLALATLASTALAHGTVNGVVADGKYFPGWKNDYYYSGSSPSGVVGWHSEGLDNGYVGGDRTGYDSPDIVCHMKASPAKSAATVAAGGTLEFQWTQWPDSHVGPMITYVAKCDGDSCADADRTKLKWVKIDEAGFVNGQWAAISMMKNNNTWAVKVPKNLAKGSYVFRHETIALHAAQNPKGAQNYPFCLNIDVTGSGTATPDDGVLGTALYTVDEKGIVWNVYNNDNTQYPVPGPKLWSGASSTGTGSGSGSGSAPGSPSTTAPATTAAPSTTAPAATAAPSKTTVPTVPAPSATGYPTNPAPSTGAPSTGVPSKPAPAKGLTGEFTIDELEKWLTANTQAGKKYTMHEVCALLEKASRGNKARRHAREFI